MRERQIHFIFIFFAFIKSDLYGFIPADDGDYSYLYPKLCLGIYVLEHEHVLPYYMGLLEDFRYPKDQLHLFFYSKSANNSIHQWVNEFPSGLYRSINLFSDEQNWWESALSHGRQKFCQFLYLGDTDMFLRRDSFRQLISFGKVVVSPLLNSPMGTYSNSEGLQLEEKFLQREKLDFVRVYYSKGPLIINLKHPDSSYLTFTEENILNYIGNGDPIDVFAFSAFSLDIPIFFTNHFDYGYCINSRFHNEFEHMEIFSSFLASQFAENGPLPVSTILEPWYPIPTKFGFDEIYLINLNRRPERLKKMNQMLRLLGIQFKRVEAIDGYNLTQRYLTSIKFLPGYLDPYHKRPMKLGEIGCFLSHFKVWEDIVNNGYERAIILEDDVHFTRNGKLIINKMIEDLIKTHLEWDFIYLGRKKMTPNGDEFFVASHRFLSTVAYSYWTIGYAISLQGAKKLITARPLDQMIALDEFLPIMYNRHPNQNWTEKFSPRNLHAFSIYPVAIEPEKYTHQLGYVSDTESSPIIGHGVDIIETKSREETIFATYIKNEL